MQCFQNEINYPESADKKETYFFIDEFIYKDKSYAELLSDWGRRRRG